MQTWNNKWESCWSICTGFKSWPVGLICSFKSISNIFQSEQNQNEQNSKNTELQSHVFTYFLIQKMIEWSKFVVIFMPFSLIPIQALWGFELDWSWYVKCPWDVKCLRERKSFCWVSLFDWFVTLRTKILNPSSGFQNTEI